MKKNRPNRKHQLVRLRTGIARVAQSCGLDDKIPGKPKNFEQIVATAETIDRGWNTLCAEISGAIQTSCNIPHLGLATTRELLDELRARIEMHALGGLDYRTVDGEKFSEAARTAPSKHHLTASDVPEGFLD